ncbi:pseudouridine synthase [Curvibacter cyanobacteriorum]|uniref:pseudouridine synthase n=1 Tax=Curvibacter cyanobacteriorum TaxID=3026422 RepID=UPI0030818CED
MGDPRGPRGPRGPADRQAAAPAEDKTFTTRTGIRTYNVPSKPTPVPVKRPPAGPLAGGPRGAPASRQPSGTGRRPADGLGGAPTGPRPDRAARPATAGATVGEGDTQRLNKRMAELGMCSRREADDWVDKGWVRVNGVVAEMGQQVRHSDRIEIDDQARGQQDQQVTILLHKPVGYVSGQAEDGHEPAVVLIQSRNRWAGDTSPHRFQVPHLRGLAPAGRLDIDSVGLLVLTQDGRVARQLIGEDSETEKEYLVRVTYATPQGDVALNVQAVFPPEQLERLRHGLSLDGQALRPAQVDWQNPEQLRFVLKEGKKRQIRRMCEQVGLKVVGLKRIRIGRVVLGQLPVGQWRYLGAHEQF